MPILPKPTIKKSLDFIPTQYPQTVQDTSKSQGLTNISIIICYLNHLYCVSNRCAILGRKMSELMNNGLEEISEWRDFTYTVSGNIRDALKRLNKLPIRLLLIESAPGNLVGTVSEGDIRRALIKGSEATSSITECINSHPLVAREDDDLNQILQAMTNLVIPAVPKISATGTLVGLLKLSNTLVTLKENKCDVLIMAGGKGSRLGPLTNLLPKPLIKFGNETIIEIIIKKMVQSGFKNIYISIGYLGNQIRDYLQSGAHIGAKISYIEEEFPHGTAGSLSLFPQDRHNPILVINGDLITGCDFREMFDFFFFHKIKPYSGSL